MPVLLNLCTWRLTSFFVAVTKLTTKKVCGPSGAGEVVCKWLHVPLHWLHKVFLGLLILKQSTVQSATLFFRLLLTENFYSTCTSLWWSSILLLLGMILNIFNVLKAERCTAGGVKCVGGEGECITDLYSNWYLRPGGKEGVLSWVKLATPNWHA